MAEQKKPAPQKPSPPKAAPKKAETDKKFVNPVLSWCLFAGALAIACLVAYLVLTPLA